MTPVNAALCDSLKGAQLQAKGRQFPETLFVKFVCRTGRYKIRIGIIELVLENLSSFTSVNISDIGSFLHSSMNSKCTQIGKKPKGYLRNYATWKVKRYNVTEARKRMKHLSLPTVVRSLSVLLSVCTEKERM